MDVIDIIVIYKQMGKKYSKGFCFLWPLKVFLWWNLIHADLIFLTWIKAVNFYFTT